jgi:hypothetical protein
MAAQYLSNKQNFNINALDDEIIFVFICDTNSSLAQTQSSYVNEYKGKLESLNAIVLFVTKNESETNIENFIFDPSSEIISLSDKINPKKPGENLMILRNGVDGMEHLETKESPENEYNWIEAINTYTENYQVAVPDEEGYYKWGQKVMESGEYLCKDCGYILELEAGQVYPICEVCLSGEPSGPSTQSEGYWEKV